MRFRFFKPDGSVCCSAIAPEMMCSACKPKALAAMAKRTAESKTKRTGMRTTSTSKTADLSRFEPPDTYGLRAAAEKRKPRKPVPKLPAGGELSGEDRKRFEAPRPYDQDAAA